MNESSQLHGVSKKIVAFGRGSDEIGKGIKDTKFVFHFQTIVEEDSDVLDDSRKWNRPMELIYGHQFKLDLWEKLLSSMRVDEVAEFKCRFNLVMSYPKVAAQLRKIMLEQKPAEPETHCCGASLQNLSVGYDDLDRLISHPPPHLIFRIHLLEWHPPGSFEKEVWTLSDDEKLNRIEVLRSEGNDEYRQGNVGSAHAKYSEAIALLDQLLLKEKPKSDEHNKLNEKRCVLLLNYCQCCLLQRDYYKVIQYTSEICEFQPDNVKAFYKRAQAHKNVHNYEEAIKDMERALELDPNLNTFAVKFIASVQEERAANDKTDKQMFKNMLTTG